MRAELDDIGALLAERRGPAVVGVRLRSSSDACGLVRAAIYSAQAYPTFEAAVCFAVALGGDTDTVAAMTGATPMPHYPEPSSSAFVLR